MSNRKKAKSSASTAPAVKLSEPMSQCLALLKAIMAKTEAGPFLEPVDWKFYGLMDYPTIIKTPMDLSTVLNNLEQGRYSSTELFAKDVRLIWRNAMTYNRPDSDIYATADKFKRLFDRRFSKIAKTGGVRRRRENEPQVSRVDQTRFANLASALNSEDLGVLIDMLQKECPEALNEEDDDDVEIEIGAIDSTTLLSLISFAETCLNNAKKKKVPSK